MGQLGDRVRGLADRLDELGDDLKQAARSAAEKAIATLEGILDRAESGEEEPAPEDSGESDGGLLREPPEEGSAPSA